MDIFPGCDGKGTNIVIRVDSKKSDRRFKIADLATDGEVGTAYYSVTLDHALHSKSNNKSRCSSVSSSY